MAKKIMLAFTVLTLVFSVVNTSYAEETKKTYYVSALGDDCSDGSIDAPFKTVERAKMQIKYLKEKDKFPIGGVEFVFREGKYIIPKTEYFNSSISGNENAPIVFKSYEGENAVFTGGIDLDITESNGMKYIDVSSLKLDACEERYTKNAMQAGLPFVLSENGNLLYSARYPNEGFIEYKSYGKTDSEFYLEYTDADKQRISQWGDNVYMAGFPNVEWEYSKCMINSISDGKINMPLGASGFINGAHSTPKLWFTNIKSELDSPGEYYYDKESERIYLIPYSDSASSVTLSFSDDRMFYIVKSKNIRFKDITFEGFMGDAIKVLGGENIVFDGCTVRAAGGNAITFSGGKECEIVNSKLYNLGTGGVSFTGGDRYNLEASGNAVKNCCIHDFSEIKPVYSPAVYLGGVGNKAINCEMYNSHHTAVILKGNDGIVENCYIHDVLQNANDSGAIYAVNDASCRGNIIRSNYFENIGNSKPAADKAYSSYGNWAVYMDGYTSGQTITENVFDEMVGGIFINQGGYNTVSENKFINVNIPVTAFGVLSYDAYGNLPAYLNSFRNVFYGKYFNKNAWSKYEGYLLLRSLETPSQLYRNNVITYNEYYGPLCLYTTDEKAPNGKTVILTGEEYGTVFENNESFSQIPENLFNPEKYGVQTNGV